MQHLSVDLNQNLLNALIDNLANAVLFVDPELRIVLANPMAGKWAGREKKGLTGRGAGEMLGCIYAQQSAKGCGFGQPCGLCSVRQLIGKTLRFKNGDVLLNAPMEIAGQGARILKVGAQYLSFGQGEGVLLSVEDVTEARTQALLRAEKNKLEAVLQKAAAVCHELNQPLMVMGGCVELLLESRSQEDAGGGLLRTLHDQVARTAAISKKLMGLSAYRATPGAGTGRVLDMHLFSNRSAAS